MSLAEDYRRRALEADGIAAQMSSDGRRRWLVLARSWRDLADALEGQASDAKPTDIAALSA
jgi:hypothetical protein